MKMNMYTIFDVASGAYMRPFFMPSDGQAKRAFKDISTDAEHEVGRHPEDYTLYKVGIFDDNSGEVMAFSPEKIVTALACVSESRQITPGQLKVFDEEMKANG
jgi:hypothetical protein